MPGAERGVMITYVETSQWHRAWLRLLYVVGLKPDPRHGSTPFRKLPLYLQLLFGVVVIVVIWATGFVWR